ncbi:MAG TPA: FkbM family methyltransferase [Candidatus Paceibacterota bacterium]|nr:FkbM family methyltransferase [Candidatus Paceibacterota bacterium]
MSRYPTLKLREREIPNYEIFQWDIEDNLPQIIGGKRSNVIVVGAWRGEEIISFLKWPNPNIWAFEPNPHNFHYLKENYKKNKEVHCFNWACGETNGVTNLYEANITGNDSLLEIRESERIKIKKIHKVEVRRLDSIESLAGRDFDLLWIDAQGFELPILKGAGSLLNQTKALFLELNEDDRTYKESTRALDLETFLKEKGFYNAHQEKHDETGSGLALFLRHEIKTTFFDQQNIDLRIKSLIENRRQFIFIPTNPFFRFLRKLLPEKIKNKIKRHLKKTH